MESVGYLKARVRRYRSARVSSWLFVLFGFALISSVTISFHFLLLFLLVAPMFASMLRGDRLVLWLRRFHQTDEDVHPFDRVLLSSSRLLGAVPVTPQDSSFSYSAAAAMGRGENLVDLLRVGLIASLVFLVPGQLILAATEIFGEPVSRSTWIVDAPPLVWLALGLNLASLVAAFLAMRRRLRQRGFRILSEQSVSPQVEALFGRIKSGDVYSNGVEILSCGDGFWRQVVGMGLDSADAIVIDVTMPSESIHWEIRTALEKAPDRVILVHRDADGVLPEAARTRLQEQVPNVDLGTIKVVAYRGTKASRKELQRQLLVALSPCLETKREAGRPLPANRRSGSWTRSRAWLISGGALIGLVLLAFGRQASNLADPSFAEKAPIDVLLKPGLALLGMIHGLAAARLLAFLHSRRAWVSLSLAVLLFLAGYLGIFAMRGSGYYLEMKTMSPREQVFRELQNAAPDRARMDAILVAHGMDDDDSRQALLVIAKELLGGTVEELRSQNSREVWEWVADYDSTIAYLGPRGIDPVPGPRRTHWEWISYWVSHVLFVMGMAGIVQAVVSRRTNQDLRSARSCAGRILATAKSRSKQL